ncbi:MAG: GTPase HflX [Bacteroidia bacterium]|nr:GTPase HflX [Bacteroidia bacterium]MBP9690286.1 GTPase HflX [Bacteroidia bacterium]
MAKNTLHDTHKKQETAVLVGVVTQQQKIEQAEEYLDELAFLTLTAGARVVKRFLQRLTKPHSGTFVGEGKLQEIAAFVVANEIDMVIFDDELSPSQIRNLEQTLNCKILDRSNLILDIFATNARTAQAKMQVELAQAQYLLPRLTRMWTHLTKHAGGIGTRGPGESEIETDRRVIRDTIGKYKARLKEIEQQAETRRKNRDDKVRLTLVGYTNVGKSSILNMLSKSDVLAEDKLFATLDSTVRKVVLDDIPFLLTDTVGFIRKLPHQLIECFKSTLDEITEADALIHVVDVSHQNFEEQIAVVNNTLEEINAHKKPILLVFNKIDKLVEPLRLPDEMEEGEEDIPYLDRLKNTWMAKENAPAIFISATNKTNVQELKDAVVELVKQHSKVTYFK